MSILVRGGVDCTSYLYNSEFYLENQKLKIKSLRKIVIRFWGHKKSNLPPLELEHVFQIAGAISPDDD